MMRGNLGSVGGGGGAPSDSISELSWSRTEHRRASVEALSKAALEAGVVCGVPLIGEPGMVSPIVATARPKTAGTICISALSSAGTIAGTMTAGMREKRIRSLMASSPMSFGATLGVSRPPGPTARVNGPERSAGRRLPPPGLPAVPNPRPAASMVAACSCIDSAAPIGKTEASVTVCAGRLHRARRPKFSVTYESRR